MGTDSPAVTKAAVGTASTPLGAGPIAGICIACIALACCCGVSGAAGWRHHMAGAAAPAAEPEELPPKPAAWALPWAKAGADAPAAEPAELTTSARLAARASAWARSVRAATAKLIERAFARARSFRAARAVRVATSTA